MFSGFSHHLPNYWSKKRLLSFARAMGKKGEKKAAPTGPQIPPEVLEKLMNPPKRGVDGNLSELVRKKLISGSQQNLLQKQETQAPK